MEQPVTFWKKYSLGIVLLAMFVAAWAIMTWSDWMQFAAQQLEHHQPADVFGSSGYIWQWGVDTFSNWQADFLGQGLGILLGAYLIFKGSEQSRDSSDEVQQIVQDIEREVRGPGATDRGQRSAQAQIYRGGNLRNYGLAYALLGGFVVAWALMTWMGWMQFAAEQHEHGQSAELFGSSGYIWYWARETFMNWQADALGHGLLVVVPAYLLYKGSAASRGGMDRVQAALQRVQTALQSQKNGQAEVGSTVAETVTAPVSSDPPTFWKKYGLAVPFVALFLGGWILQTWSAWVYFVSEQAQHHQPADLFGSSGYIWLWATDTFSNWQSDILWAGLMVLLGAYLLFQGSAESRDTDDRIEDLAMSIEQQVRGEQAAGQAQQRTRRHVLGDVWHSRGLAYSLIAAGVIVWALMTWTGWMQFAAQQQEHGQTATLFGSSGYIWDWMTLTLENWQSDILGNAAVVILSAYLLYQGSGMSRGGDDEIEQGLQRIHQYLVSTQSSQPQSVPAGSIVQETRPRQS